MVNKIRMKASDLIMENNLTAFEQEFGLTVDENGKVVTNSLKIADYYSKEHKDVLKKIRGFIELIPELGEGNFSLSSYTNEQNKSQPMYKIDRSGFAMLVNKFTGDDATIFTYKYTKAFEEMAEELEHRREQSVEVLNALNEKDVKLQRKKTLDSYFGKRKTVTTFKYCSYEEFANMLSLFDEYLFTIKDSEIKRIEYNRVVDGLTQNRNSVSPNDKMYMPKTSIYSYYIQEFTKKKGSSENKSYGQRLRHKDGIIKEQQNIISTLNPPLEDYMVLDAHGLSENYMNETVENEMTGKNITVKSYVYKNWIKKFPSFQLKDKEELNVDWDRPITVFLKFDCMDKFDVQNFSKSAIDQVITRDFGEDDNIIDKVIVERNKSVESFDEGRIYVYIQNVD